MTEIISSEKETILKRSFMKEDIGNGEGQTRYTASRGLLFASLELKTSHISIPLLSLFKKKSKKEKIRYDFPPTIGCKMVIHTDNFVAGGDPTHYIMIYILDNSNDLSMQIADGDSMEIVIKHD